jgi:hypothetical protein
MVRHGNYYVVVTPSQANVFASISNKTATGFNASNAVMIPPPPPP